MKYRLIELLKCPEHPELMPRAVSVRLSDVFPYSGDIEFPFCKTGCGLLGNWFSEIPVNLPAANRMNCRRCFGTEIEMATIECPGCGRNLRVEDGVLVGTEKQGAETQAEIALPLKTQRMIDKLLNPVSGDVILLLAPISNSVLRHWADEDIERVHVEPTSESMLTCRARSCADGEGLQHYIAGPLDLKHLRPKMFDCVVMTIPSHSIQEPSKALDLVPGILRQSGRALLIFTEPVPKLKRSELVKHLLGLLPDSFREFEAVAAQSPSGYLLLLQPHPMRLAGRSGYLGRKSRQPVSMETDDRSSG
jgi:uncharacterized protein YbaR (Trm112 family)